MQLDLLKIDSTSSAVLARVISGGQMGVDIAALRAARAVGIPTGGRMPRGFKTQDGPRPEYAALYGLEEDSSYEYPPRTETNVRQADATLRIARDFASAGERCTLRAIVKYQRPKLDLTLSTLRSSIVIAQWWLTEIRAEVSRPLVLNVAGNSERTAPGIGAEAENFLRDLFLVVSQIPGSGSVRSSRPRPAAASPRSAVRAPAPRPPGAPGPRAPRRS